LSESSGHQVHLRGGTNWIGGGARRVPIIQTERGFPG